MGEYKDPDYRKKYMSTPEYKERRRWRYLRERYGVTKEQWQAMFEKQNGMCAICGIHQIELKKSLDTDHNHATGEVRGLLCMECNTKLGVLEDSEFVAKASIYLNRSKIKAVK